MKEDVEEPLLSQDELRRIFQILGGHFSSGELDLFSDIVYSGFKDPYAYDEVYSDFVLSYFSTQLGSEDFAKQSSAQIKELKPFLTAWNSRASDEEYHQQVLDWTLSDLQLRHYATDHEGVEYLVVQLSKKYGASIVPLQPGENLFSYWHHVNEESFWPLQKTILKQHLEYMLLICDISNEDELVSLLARIDWPFGRA
jgi:hypothetical protein